MEIASYIDHTLLRPDCTAEEIDRLCQEATTYGFATVCVPPCYVRQAKARLEGTAVKVGTVIGFPLGYASTGSKLMEIAEAVNDGADELDVVHNIAAWKNRHSAYLLEELNVCLGLAHSHNKVLKLIVESSLMSEEELAACCALYATSELDFLKTSTGFSSGGATVQAVKIMRAMLPERIQVKASGGIRDYAFAQELIAAGAGRLGCSASVAIVEESRKMNTL